jgi:hypothetical protein
MSEREVDKTPPHDCGFHRGEGTSCAFHEKWNQRGVPHPDGGAPPLGKMDLRQRLLTFACYVPMGQGENRAFVEAVEELALRACPSESLGGAPPEPMDAMVVAFQREASAHGLDCPDHVVRPALLCALLVRAASRHGEK